jgi:hypothetical protein
MYGGAAAIMPKKRTIPTQFDPDEESWLRRIAAYNGRSISQVVQMSVRLMRRVMGRRLDLGYFDPGPAEAGEEEQEP